MMISKLRNLPVGCTPALFNNCFYPFHHLLHPHPCYNINSSSLWRSQFNYNLSSCFLAGPSSPSSLPIALSSLLRITLPPPFQLPLFLLFFRFLSYSSSLTLLRIVLVFPCSSFPPFSLPPSPLPLLSFFSLSCLLPLLFFSSSTEASLSLPRMEHDASSVGGTMEVQRRREVIK